MLSKKEIRIILRHEFQLRIESFDPRKTTREVAQELNVDHSTVLRHLKQIGKSKKLDKWVPHDLNKNKKNRRQPLSATKPTFFSTGS